MLGCGVDAFLAEVVTVAGVFGAAAHEAGFRAVINHRYAACGEHRAGPHARLQEIFGTEPSDLPLAPLQTEDTTKRS